MSLMQFQKNPIWIPKEKSNTKMSQFMKIIEKKYGIKINDYWDLHKWSVDNIAEFWGEIWDFFGIVHSKSYDQVIDVTIPMEECPKWFEGARLNLAENLLRHRSEKIALIATGEDRETERITYKQLYEETKVYAEALRKFGLQKEDRVASYLSNRKEAVICMLATASLGAIWTGGLPTLGPQAYLNRLKQVSPRVLITIDEFTHDKEKINLLKNIKEITDGLPSLENVIIIPSKAESKLENIKEIRNSCFLDDFLSTARNTDGTVPDVVFEQVSFSHPVFINYTSGTTGLPKTIVHGSGGLLLGVREFMLHWNGQGEIWLSMSPVGWVSWHMIIFDLFTEETIVLFEGVPYFLSPTYFWDLLEEFNVSRIFVTPSVLDALEAKRYLPTEKHRLDSLNMILAGSSVVKPHNYDFALNHIKKGVQFSPAFGCTETMAFCIVTEHTLPLYKGEIASPCLGVAVESLDSEGNPVVGEMADLVISKPLPGFPLGFWGDIDGKIYRKSYFSKYPGKFAMGDTVIINPITKGIIACGRCDETIKQGACRFGSAEIYDIVHMFPEIRDCLCVSQLGKNMDERAILFIQLADGFSFSEDLVQRLRNRIAEELTPAHVPEVILEAPGIPHNANGKKTEIIVKKIINGRPHNAESVANSECLKYYYNIPEIQGY